jgi:hypothetical protein
LGSGGIPSPPNPLSQGGRGGDCRRAGVSPRREHPDTTLSGGHLLSGGRQPAVTFKAPHRRGAHGGAHGGRQPAALVQVSRQSPPNSRRILVDKCIYHLVRCKVRSSPCRCEVVSWRSTACAARKAEVQALRMLRGRAGCQLTNAWLQGVGGPSWRLRNVARRRLGLRSVESVHPLSSQGGLTGRSNCCAVGGSPMRNSGQT